MAGFYAAVDTMNQNREKRQRDVYLDRFSIRRAKIPGIGPAKTAVLISFGIETAADVTERAIRQAPGFGDVMTGKLMGWRRKLLSHFRYDPTPNAQDIADEHALRGRFAKERAKLASTIHSGLQVLRTAKASFVSLPEKAKKDKALIEAVSARAQAEADLRELGVSVPATKVTLPLTAPWNRAN